MTAHRGVAGTALLTALAPAAWGSTYFVTHAYLPADRPLLGAVVRALPSGLLLMAAARRLPQGTWWWRTGVLAVLNVAGFLPLIYLAATHLSSGLAATLTATAPIAAMALAWPLVGERPTLGAAAGALAGLVGVSLLVGTSGQGVDVIGVIASLAAVLTSSLGVVLLKRWQPPVTMFTITAWQLLAGGLLLTPFALWIEGRPPAVDASAMAAYAYTSLIGTALAFIVWFSGVRRLPVASVALIGLLNPIVGTLLGVWLDGEPFHTARAIGVGLVLGGVLLGHGVRRPARAPVPALVTLPAPRCDRRLPGHVLPPHGRAEPLETCG